MISINDALPIEVLAYILSLAGNPNSARVCQKFKIAFDFAKLSFLQKLISVIGANDFQTYKSTSEYFAGFSFSLPPSITLKELKEDRCSSLFAHVGKIYYERIRAMNKDQLPPSRVDFSPLSLARFQEIRLFEQNQVFLDFMDALSFAQEACEKARFSCRTTQEKVEFLRGYLKREDLSSITILNLSRRNLFSLPPEMSLFKNLSSLLLQQNRLLTLPAELCSLKNLQSIHVKDCPISYVPKELQELQIHYD